MKKNCHKKTKHYNKVFDCAFKSIQIKDSVNRIKCGTSQTFKTNLVFVRTKFIPIIRLPLGIYFSKIVTERDLTKF